jgi:hypothetical protein
VKRGAFQNYELGAQGDEIEGFVLTVEDQTVNDGFSFGSVQRDKRIEAVVGANQVGTMAVKDFVVADEQVALNTAGAPKVKTGTAGGTTTTAMGDGTAQAGANTTITLAAGASATDDYYNGATIQVIAGTGAGQSRVITDYVGSTKVATVAAWGTNPDNTSVYTITKQTTTETSPNRFLWRCIRIVSGTGAAGDKVLIERQ